ncbi:twin-arginine translocase TatA/TatE family subunit [Flavobacterium sp.]|uniref:Sec-independent protein translocase subunit TatA/TatB n=1 Tax=Flavobacterium sp. TaxID=239 RepID=UPI0038FC7018
MFGIGGGELIFILFIILMLFGSDKVPEMARTMGKAMAQLKNATNDIKSEIQKGSEANGFDPKSLTAFTQNFTSEIDETKKSIVGNYSKFTEDIDVSSNTIVQETTTEFKEVTDDIVDSLGAIKRKK